MNGGSSATTVTHNCVRWGGRFLPFSTLLLGLMLVLCQTALAQGLKVSIDRERVAVGESATLQLIFENCQPEGDPTVPAIPNVTIQPVGTTTSINIVNGQRTAQLIYSYTVTPQREGDFTLATFTCQVQGRKYAVPPVKLSAGKGNQQEISQYAFLKWILPKTNLFLGETMPAELRLYVQRMNGGDMPQVDADGFTMGKLPQPQEGRSEVNGKAFQVLVFKTYLVPVKTGNLVLGPTRMKMNIPKPGTGNRRRDPFGGFFGGSFFDSTEWQSVMVEAEPLPVQVKPLPTANVPPGFSGAVGVYAMNVSASPTNVAVGDPITLKVEFSGAGQLDSLALPSLKDWKEFKTYPPTSKLENQDALGLGGRKYFEQVVVPQNTEVRELPPFSFAFFDPEAQAYRTLNGPKIPLIVRPSASAQSMTQTETATNTVDIVHIKPHLGMVTTWSTPLVFKPWFIALQGAPIVVWLIMLFRRKQAERLANNPRLRRQREIAKVIEAGLRQLPQFAVEKQNEQFFAMVFRLLQEQIGERLDLPASAITEAVVQEKLRPLGVPEDTLTALENMFQVCNQARYAPVQSAEQLDDLIVELQKILGSLRKWQPGAGSNTPLNGLLIGGLGLLAAFSLHAGEMETAFDQANKLYEQGRYRDAVGAYQKLIESGSISATIYYNLGNALFKAGQTGYAIEALRRAELLSPRDPDIRGNLQFIRRAVTGKQEVGPQGWQTWLQRLTINEWALLTTFCFWVGMLLLAMVEWQPEKKKAYRNQIFAVFGVFVVLASCLGISAATRFEETAIVIKRDGQARQGPFEESKNAFAVPDGTELVVLDAKDDWLQVRDMSQHIGWVKRSQVIIFKTR